MDTETMHAPTPLAYDREEGRLYVADGDVMATVAWMDDNTSEDLNDEHADYIVRAVNAHDEMLEALQRCVQWRGKRGYESPENPDALLPLEEQEDDIASAMRAIAKAEGRS